MNADQARQVVFWHYGQEYPERDQSDFTPRGFWLHAAIAFRRHAGHQRSDSAQNEPAATRYDALAEAAAVLAEAPDGEEDEDDPGGIPDPKPADEPHGHWHVKHPLTGWQRLWHLNHFGDTPGHSHERFGLGPRC